MKKVISTVALSFLLTLLCEMMTFAAPGKVQGMKQTGAKTSSVTLQWNRLAGAVKYDIYDMSSGKTVASTNGTSVEVKSLKQDCKYQLAVVAKDSSQAQGKYALITAKTLANPVTGITAKRRSASTVGLSWDKKNQADGYQIQVYTYRSKGVGQPINTKSYTNVKVKSVNSDQFYQLKVRSYVTTASGNVYSDWSILRTTNNVTLKTKVVNKGIQLSWKKVKGAVSYTIYGRKGESRNSSTYKKIITTKKIKYVVKKIGSTKLKKNNTYYFYIVANRKVKGRTYKSIVSTVYLRPYV